MQILDSRNSNRNNNNKNNNNKKNNNNDININKDNKNKISFAQSGAYGLSHEILTRKSSLANFMVNFEVF